MEYDCTNSSLLAVLRESTGVPPLGSTYTVVCGCVLFLALIASVLLQFRALPLGGTSILVVGVCLFASFRVIEQDDVYAVLCRQENWDCVFRLLGLMLLIYFIDREGLIEHVFRKCFKPVHRWEWNILVVCVISFILSAAFSSEIACLILTPLLIQTCDQNERPKKEVEVYLLGLVTTSHLASSCSVFGGTHMVLLASHTSSTISAINLHVCVLYLLPAAALTGSLNILALLFYFRLRMGHFTRDRLVSEGSPDSEQEMRGLTQDNCGSAAVYSNGMVQTYHREGSNSNGYAFNHREDRLMTACQLETIPEDEVLVIESSIPSLEQQVLRLRYIDDTSSDSSEDNDDFEPESNNESSEHITEVLQQSQEFHPSTTQMLRRSENICLNMNLHLTGSRHSLQRNRPSVARGILLSARFGISRSLFAISALEFLPAKPLPCHNPSDSLVDPPQTGRLQLFRSIRQRPFPVVLVILLLLLLVSLILQSFNYNLQIGLVAMALGTVALLADAAFTRNPGADTVRSMDWSIVLYMFAYFTIMDAFYKTGVPSRIWHHFGLSQSSYRSPLHILILTVFSSLSSIIFTNVPVVSFVLTQLEPCSDQLPVYLYTAWLTSVAGAIPLYNSVANITVSYIADNMGHRLAFWRHLLFTAITSLILGLSGTLLIYGLLKLR